MGGISNVKQMLNGLKSMGNPQILLNNAMAKKPQLKSIIDECGGDYQKAFYKAAEMQGVNPDDILPQILFRRHLPEFQTLPSTPFGTYP